MIAHLNGIDVYYERAGEGPRLLFLNGSGATLERTGPLVKLYAKAFDTVAHDQRGLGKTSIPAGPYSMADYAADAAALAEHIGWDRYRVVGTSFGGMVAQELAVTFPERIERLVLVCTSCGGSGGASYPLHTLIGMSDAERSESMRTIMDTRFTDEWLAQHAAERAFVEMWEGQAAVAKDPEVLRGERLQLEARRDLDVWDRLPKITCPTLVASGRYDGIAPPANGKAIADQIPDADFRLYEGGHMFFIQDPAAVPDIVGFLAG